MDAWDVLWFVDGRGFGGYVSQAARITASLSLVLRVHEVLANRIVRSLVPGGIKHRRELARVRHGLPGRVTSLRVSRSRLGEKVME